MNIRNDVKNGIHDRPPKRKNILNVVGNAIFVLLIVFFAASFVLSIRAKATGGIPTVGGYKLLVVQSGSMEPVIHTGALAFVRLINDDSLAVNDVITFKSMNSNNQMITHRIVAVEIGLPLRYVTRGDANDANDPKAVNRSDVIGKVQFSLPYVGYFLAFTRTKMGALALLIIPGILMAIFELRNLFKLSVQLELEKKEKMTAESK